jgi:Domain of unknown function (DUF4352)
MTSRGLLAGPACLLLMAAAGGCGDPSVKQRADPVTVTVTVTDTGGTPTEATSSEETATEDTEADQGLASVGDTITLHGYEDGEQMAVTVTRLYDPAAAAQYLGPRRGRKYVAVDLVLKNTGTKAYSDSPGNGATLLDTRDHGYTETLSETTSCQYIGSSVKIAPGSKRAGCLIFEVPKDAKPAVFQFGLDSGFADETGEWQLH